MERILRALWIAFLPACAALAQDAGDLPPALVWDELKADCPPSLDWLSLRGKVVVVSMRSGDSPTPEQISEWNELLQKFEGQPVAFLSVMGGSEFLLGQALEKTRYRGCVLFDKEEENRGNFGVFPDTTVIVNDWGLIAGYASGDSDEETVQAVLRHQTAAGLLDSPPQPQAPGAESEPPYGVHIAPAPRLERRALGPLRPDRYIAKNQPLRLIILDLWETPEARILFPEKWDERNYDVIVRLAVQDADLVQKTAREAIEQRFGLSISKEEQPRRVYLLAVRGASPHLRPAESSQWSSGGGLESIMGTAETMAEIAVTFEGLLNTPVIDQTGRQGRYDYAASSKLPGPESAFDMARQLGLELTEGERSVEMLVVRRLW